MFDRTPSSPQLDSEFRGVALALERVAAAGRWSRLWAHGAYQLDDREAAAIVDGPRQRALVLTCVSGLRVATRRLVGDRVLLWDDEAQSGSLVRGYFRIDLLANVSLDARCPWTITASLGPFLSPTLRADPRGPDG